MAKRVAHGSPTAKPTIWTSWWMAPSSRQFSMMYPSKYQFFGTHQMRNYASCPPPRLPNATAA
eukprot:7682809-Pyramimonas_sp.AAC.1